MSDILFFKDISKESVRATGGKGASLGELTRAGIPVPPGFVVLASAFERFVDAGHLTGEISARLREAKSGDIGSIERASTVLRDVIHNTPMPEGLSADILAAYHLLGAAHTAVRSSATAEDSSFASWAGELETYLNTTEDVLLDRIKRCWSSLFTPRAIFYRHEKNLTGARISVAVVVQAMVQSEISGIAFTVHPVTEDRNQMIIEAGYGLGEAIVGGHVTPDSYVVGKHDMSIADIMIGGQTKKLVRSTANSQQTTVDSSPSTVDRDMNEWIELTTEEGERQKLTGRQIIELAELCKKIENHYGFPCDIEWAYADGRFFITQSRPITTLRNRS